MNAIVDKQCLHVVIA